MTITVTIHPQSSYNERDALSWHPEYNILIVYNCTRNIFLCTTNHVYRSCTSGLVLRPHPRA